MPNAQPISLNNSGIRVDMSNEEHSTILQEEVIAHIICDEFTNTQSWAAATGLASILIQMINGATTFLRTRGYMGPQIRQNVDDEIFPMLNDEFLCDSSHRHRNETAGHDGTHAFSWLSKKGYLTYMGAYVWGATPKLVEACNSVISRLEGTASEEVAGSGRSELDPLSGLKVEYFYRGRKIDKDMYHHLRDDGLDGRSLTLEFSASGVVVHPEQILLSLVEGGT